MRDAFVTYSHRTGDYTVTLRENKVIKETRTTSNYHDLGLTISNWIHNGY